MAPAGSRGKRSTDKTVPYKTGLRPSLFFWLSLTLALATLAVYWPVQAFQFVNLDDPDAITLNPHLPAGLSLEGFRWAFTSTDTTWFPLTRLSQLFDYQLFHLHPGGHHLTNVALHIAASLVLFAFLTRATGAIWPSAFVALVFALHPLHVQSVAWVAERKDVLCALFWFLTLWVWTRYIERPSPGPYLLSLLFFAGGLMSKPMIVTLPVLLLLLDYWPYRRPLAWQLCYEKIPFLLLSAAAAVLTFLTQQSAGAVSDLNGFPLAQRLQNALYTLVVYPAQTLWPRNLAIIYPYPDRPVWQAVVTGLVLAAAAYAVWRARRHRFLTVGWLWYLVTLLPVIGIVQVGLQSRADRYMYVPMVGLAAMLAWSAVHLLQRFPGARKGVIAFAATACVGMAAVTARQLTYWRDTETLYRHTLSVTQDNYLAMLDLSNHLEGTPGRLSDAMDLLREAIRIHPVWPELRMRLASQLMQAKRYDEAIAEAQVAVGLAPALATAHTRLALALVAAGKREQALPTLISAVRLDPANREARNYLGVVLMGLGRMDEAIPQLEAAVLLDPSSATGHLNLGAALNRVPGRRAEAIRHFETALKLHPDPALQRQLDHLRSSP